MQVLNLLGPELETTELGARARVMLDHDSFTQRDYLLQAEGLEKDRKRTRFDTHLELGLELRDVKIEPRDGSDDPLLDGRAEQLIAKVSPFLSQDLRRKRGGGLGQWDTRLTFQFKKGFDLFDGDFDYEQYHLILSTQLFFGFRSSTDFFIRYVRGFGASVGNAPLFEFFRLGGTQTIRGLEEGELIGPNLVYNQLEGGVELDFIVEQLAGFYLKLFVDWGKFEPDASADNLVDFGGGLEGYGLAAEFRNLPAGGAKGHLTVGYAWSPDSELHENGVPVVAFSVDF